jgi:esterase
MSTALYHQIFKHDDTSPWIILIHGLFGNSDNLSVIRRHLQNQYNIITIDLPDHGQSAHTDEFTLPNCVSSLIALLDELALNSVHLIGHSLGGKVAMLTALSFPQRVRSLIVLDIAPVVYTPHHNSVFLGLNNVDLETVTQRKDAEQQMSQYIIEPSTRQFLLKSLYKDEDQHWHWRFNLSGLEHNYNAIKIFPAPKDSQYNGPVTFIKGANSDYLLPEHQSTIAKYFPKAKAKVVENTGHWLHAEKPQTVNKIIERALAS